MKQFRHYFLSGLTLVLLAALLNACSGGGGSGGSSSTTNASSSAGTAAVAPNVNGTVTGLGSIIVDDQEYTETATTLYQTEGKGAPGALAANAVQLGQHVALTLDANGNITSVDVIPDVEGTVSSITSSVSLGSGSSATTAPAITVSGVLVIANTDPTQGPVTTYGGGYTALTSVLVGDNIEVHGLLRSSNGVDYVQASFIGKQPSFIGTRITGTVVGYSATANTFTLGSGSNTITISTTGATLLPTNATLSNGEVVSVWSNGTLTNNTLTANFIAVRSHTGVAGETLAVSGAISGYVSISNFVVNGVTVDASGIALPKDVSALSNGMVVAVSGTVNSSGALVATQLRVFESHENVAPPVRLQGNISDFVSASNFAVRGVVVDGSQNPTFNAGFSAANLQDGAFINVTGTLSNNTVVATAISIISVPGTAVVDVRATVQSYDASTGVLSVTLTVPGASQTSTVSITLGSSVTYVNGTAAKLVAGQNIVIHAIYTSATSSFTVTVISFLPPPPTAPKPGNNPVLLQGVVTSVTPSSGAATSFVVHGLTIDVSSTTTVVTASGATGTLAVGDLVAVFAQPSTGNTLTASVILVAPAPAVDPQT